jgi:hypothetical protein
MQDRCTSPKPTVDDIFLNGNSPEQKNKLHINFFKLKLYFRVDWQFLSNHLPSFTALRPANTDKWHFIKFLTCKNGVSLIQFLFQE